MMIESSLGSHNAHDSQSQQRIKINEEVQQRNAQD